VVISQLVAEDTQPAFTDASTATPVTDVTIGIGDVVTVTVFESAAGGLFIPPDAGARPGNYVSLPPQQVDRNGAISVPFIGPVRAAGQTPTQLGSVIEQRLASRALGPQVVVTLTERRSGNVTVIGDVNTAARFPLDAQGERLLSAVARAGGSRYPSYETVVTLQRGTAVERARLSEISTDPRQNVALRPGDVVFVSREQRYFVSLGAMGQNQAVAQINRRFPFDDARLTMADAIGRAGGIADQLANPRAVFLYRFESRQTLERAGLTVGPEVTGPVPTVYVADFLDPAVFFLASRFPMRNGDLMYTSNAPAAELAKFLALILPTASSIGSIRSVF
jgi:polysaccharide biosynthesis/export protein